MAPALQHYKQRLYRRKRSHNLAKIDLAFSVLSFIIAPCLWADLLCLAWCLRNCLDLLLLGRFDIGIYWLMSLNLPVCIKLSVCALACACAALRPFLPKPNHFGINEWLNGFTDIILIWFHYDIIFFLPFWCFHSALNLISAHSICLVLWRLSAPLPFGRGKKTLGATVIFSHSSEKWTAIMLGAAVLPRQKCNLTELVFQCWLSNVKMHRVDVS